MILGVLILALLGGIAYFHYAQGFFSATLSALCAVIAAVIAVGYHEVMVFSLLQGAAADYAHAMCLGALFAIVYIVLRVLFDKAIPGNVRLPVAVDRVGGAAMGVIAGIFTAGIVALAAQMLPFGPTVGGHARYAVEDRPEMNIPGRAGQRQRNVDINEQLAEDTFVPEKRAKLLIPVDDMVLSVVDALSTGAMAADQPLSKVHPDYPTELFGQRLGIQVSAKHTALNMPGKTAQVTLADPGLFRVDADVSKTAVDNELPQLHQRAVTYKRDANALQLVVRLLFSKDASDSDQMVRISTGAVRLVAEGANYYPLGTMDGGKLYLNKVDDFIFVSTKEHDGGVDFFFAIEDPSKVVQGGPKDPAQTIKDGVFIEAKRLARIDLGGKQVTPGVKSSDQLAVQFKPDIAKAAAKGEALPTATEFSFRQVTFNAKLINPINVGTPAKDIKDQTLTSGTVSLTNREISKLEINPTQTIALLSQGENQVDQLHVPGGKKLVQVWGDPAESDAWAWAAALSKWQLVDSKGKAYPPAGAFCRVQQSNADRMVAVYNTSGAPGDITNTEGKPQDVAVLFLVPAGTQLRLLKFNNKMVQELDQQAQ